MHTASCNAFDASIAERLGPAAWEDDFPAVDLTPEYEPIGINSDLKPDQEDLKVTSEAHDNYVGVELMLPKGGTMSRGRVTA